MHFTFEFRGKVRGQGRPRFTRNGHAYESDADRNYKTIISHAYFMGNGPWFGTEPVRVTIDVMRHLPKSKTPRAGDLADDFAEPDTHKPDLDNVAKAVLDALNGYAYADDAQVVELVVRKYPRVRRPDNMDVMRVTIAQVDETIYPHEFEQEGKA